MLTKLTLIICGVLNWCSKNKILFPFKNYFGRARKLFPWGMANPSPPLLTSLEDLLPSEAHHLMSPSYKSARLGINFLVTITAFNVFINVCGSQAAKYHEVFLYSSFCWHVTRLVWAAHTQLLDSSISSAASSPVSLDCYSSHLFSMVRPKTRMNLFFAHCTFDVVVVFSRLFVDSLVSSMVGTGATSNDNEQRKKQSYRVL